MDDKLVSVTCNTSHVCETTDYTFEAASYEASKARSAEEHAQLADGRFDNATDFSPSAVSTAYKLR